MTATEEARVTSENRNPLETTQHSADVPTTWGQSSDSCSQPAYSSMFNTQGGNSAFHQSLFSNPNGGQGFSLASSPRYLLHYRQSLNSLADSMNQAEQFAYLQAVKNQVRDAELQHTQEQAQY